MGFKDQKWSKGAHLEQSRFGREREEKRERELGLGRRSSSRWDFFPLLASKRLNNLQEKI